jgi:hypothetical protein
MERTGPVWMYASFENDADVDEFWSVVAGGSSHITCTENAFNIIL